jgi:hypothetical protein
MLADDQHHDRHAQRHAGGENMTEQHDGDAEPQQTCGERVVDDASAAGEC